MPEKITSHLSEPNLGAVSEPQLSRAQRIIYAVGGILDNFGLHGLKSTSQQIFTITLGINPVVVGAIVAGTRFWDACLDPQVGLWSDRTVTRWGRRRPYIVLGALACGITFPLVWLIPGFITGTWGVILLAAACLLFTTAYAFFSVPLHALGYELARSYHGKTQLFAARASVFAVCNLGTLWIFAVVQSGWFGSPVQSAGAVGLLLGILFFVTGSVPAFFLKEPAISNPAISPVSRILPALKLALRAAPFVSCLLLGGFQCSASTWSIRSDRM